MKYNITFLGITILFLFIQGIEEGRSHTIHLVSAKPGLFDKKSGRSVTLGHRLPVKPEGVDKPMQIYSSPTGTGKALVILLEFPDHRADANHCPSDYYELLFSTGMYPTGSMNDYYLENSYGMFGVSGDVTPWYMAPQPYTFYVRNNHGFGPYPNNAQKMVEDAVSLADPDVDFSQYDTDGDGYVDALFVVHAGPGAEETGSARDIWSHAWGTPAPLSVDGVSVWTYSMEPEKHTDGTLITIGVFCHEFGHILGLPDLYDTDYSSDGIGNFGLMGSGSWGGDGHTPEKPVHMCAWSKVKLGWITPTESTTDLFDQEIHCYENTAELFKLWTNGDLGNEYFLVSNRQKVGFDSYLAGSGLLIWHIDETVLYNNDEHHKKVDLEEADGLIQLDVYADFNRGDTGDFFPGTTTNRIFHNDSSPNSRSYDGTPTGVAVGDISNSAMVMTADLHVTGTQYPDIQLSATSYDFGPTLVNTIAGWTFTIANHGEATLTVNTIHSNHADFETSFPAFPQVLPPGSDLAVTISFTPSAIGLASGQLTVSNNDPDENTLTITVSGYGDTSSTIPHLEISETSHNFGEVPVGESVDWSLCLFNTRSAELLVTSIQSDLEDFEITSSHFPYTISQDESLIVNVSFIPPHAGQYSGHVTILSNDDDGTIEVNVTGTGLAPDMIVNPSCIEKVLSGSETASVEVSIHNQGNYPLSFEIGETANWLSIVPISGTVGINQSLDLRVILSGVSLSDGEYASDIIIHSNDPEHDGMAVPVSVVVENMQIYVGSPISFTFPADTALIPMEMDNSTEKPVSVGDFQAELHYDEAIFSLVHITPTERSNHMNTFVWSSPDEGRLILLISDTNGHTISPGTGPIAHIHFVMADSLESGEGYWIEFDEVILADECGIPLSVTRLHGLVIIGCKGDMNCDGCINMVDMICVVNIILGDANPTEAELWAADFNGDGTVDIIDIIGMVNNICIPSPSSVKRSIAAADVLFGEPTVDLNGYSTIPISVGYFGEIAGIQIEFLYDSEQFTLNTVRLSDQYIDMDMEWKDRSGFVTVLVYSRENNATPAGSNPVLTIVGEGKATAAVVEAFHLQNVVLVNGNGESIPVDYVEEMNVQDVTVPGGFSLMQNCPNPFNPTTLISYTLPGGERNTENGGWVPFYTALKVYNILGQEVRTLVDEVQDTGSYTVMWDGRDRFGREVASGFYFYTLNVGAWTATRTMTLVR